MKLYIFYIIIKPKNLFFSFSKGINKINDYDIKHLCFTGPGSGGGPILSLSSNKVIGVHKAMIKKMVGDEYKIGTFLKYPLREIS